MGRIDTATVLFTDLVGSTAVRAEVGEDAAEELRRRHHALLADAVVVAGGRVIKGLGDGILATFHAAADAVAAAVAIQQVVEADDRHGSVRVGLSCGDVTLEDDDVFGVPVVEASRLCGSAVGGEILAAEVVRVLARGRGGFVFEPMGDLDLKGLPEPVPVCRVVWEPLPHSDAAALPFPGSLASAVGVAYIGRAELLERLDRARAESAAGACRTVLLAGEPGVGKTRTAAETARRAHAAGAVVLVGHCDADLATPYQPFSEALDWYVEHTADPRLGRFPGELSRLVPEIAARPGVSPPLVSDAPTEERRLYESIASWLLDVAAEAGLVLVLDDVHWATKPTLLLLQHVLRTAQRHERPARLLVLATYRDTDVDRTHPLAATLGDLRRIPGVERLSVDGLSEEEVTALVAAAAGHELDEPARRLALTLHEETEGNPFFVGEVLRHLVETGGVRREGTRWMVADPDHVSVPEGVRDVIGRRLSQLSPDANAFLSSAAVVGRQIDLDVLGVLVELEEDRLLDALDEAVRARLIEEVGVDRFRFAHALVRTTLYEELSATRRRRMHRRIAQAIEKLRPDDVVALAYHWVEGASDEADTERSIHFVLAAGEHALRARAPSEAERHFRLALELLEDAPDAAPRLAVEARCGLGESLRDLSDARYRETLLDAGRAALDLGEVTLAVRAVLGNFRGNVSFVGRVDEERLAVAEAALAAVGDTPSHDRIRLLAQVGSELLFEGDYDRALELSSQAEELARSTGDDALLAWVIGRTAFSGFSGRRWQWVRRRNEEGLRLARAIGDPVLINGIGIFHAGGLLSSGDAAGALELTRANEELAESEGTHTMRWMARNGMTKFIAAEGRLADAAARNDELLTFGESIGEPDAVVWWASAVAGIEGLRGNIGAVVEPLRAHAESYPAVETWAGGLVWALAELGAHEEAYDVLRSRRLSAGNMMREPWPFVGPSQLALAAFWLGDRDLAADAAGVLRAYPACWAHWFTGLMGPVALPLGLALVTVGEVDAGIAEVERATAAADAVGFHAVVDFARVYLGAVLLERGAPGDRARADEILRATATRAAASGACGVEERARALLHTGSLRNL